MVADPITAICHRDYYPAYHNSGTRAIADIDLIALHDTEGGTAESNARYFKSSGSGGSTQLVVDDIECQRCLPNSAICWGAASAPQISANSRGFHIEQVGFAKWSAVVWKKHLKTLQRAAWKTAFHARAFDIPIVFLTASALVANPRAKGITTHNEISKASRELDKAHYWKYGHTDPGPFWPRRLFMFYVQQFDDDMTLTDPTNE